MTPPGHSQSTQPVHCDTARMFITSAIADMTRDLDSDCHCTRLHTQARDRNRVLVEPPRDGTQSCLYHIVTAFVAPNMTQVRRDLGAWYLQPVIQARLCDMLQTNFQSPAEWSRRSRSAPNPSNLADECDVYSLALQEACFLSDSVLYDECPDDRHTGNEGYDHWACQFNPGQTFCWDQTVTEYR